MKLNKGTLCTAFIIAGGAFCAGVIGHQIYKEVEFSQFIDRQETLVASCTEKLSKKEACTPAEQNAISTLRDINKALKSADYNYQIY